MKLQQLLMTAAMGVMAMSAATRSKGFILVEEAGGIFIRHPQFYIFFR